jgi:hypothetical protein
MCYRRHARCNGGDPGVGSVFAGFHRRGRLNHRHGGYFLISYCKNINQFSERYIHILPKIIVYNHMMPRIPAFGSRSEMETEDLTALRVAC